MQRSAQSLIRLLFSLAATGLAVRFLISGLQTAWHGFPGVCKEHVHSSQELLVFVGIGSAVALFGVLLMWLAWRVYQSPSITTVYLVLLLFLYAVCVYTPHLPGLTVGTSNCLWSVAVWSAFWFGGPRLVHLYGLKEDLESRHLLGVWAFCVLVPLFVLPPDILKAALGAFNSHRGGAVLLLSFFIGLIGILRLLYSGMVPWRRRGSRALPVVAVAAVTTFVLVAADLTYQRCCHAASDQANRKSVAQADHEGIAEQDGDTAVHFESATRFLIKEERAKKVARAEHQREVLQEQESLIALLESEDASQADREAAARLHFICGESLMIELEPPQFDDALIHFDKAVSAARDLSTADVPRYRSLLAKSLLRRGTAGWKGADAPRSIKRLYEFLSDFDESIELFEQDSSMSQRDLACAYQYRGSMLFELDRYDEAIDAYKKAVSLGEQLPAAFATELLATLYTELGNVYLQAERYGQAIDVLERGVDQYKTWADQEGRIDRMSDLALDVNLIGYAHFKQKQYRKAIQRFDEVVQLFEKNGLCFSHVDSIPLLVTAHSNRNVNYRLLGEHGNAKQALKDELNTVQLWIRELENCGGAETDQESLKRQLASAYARSGELRITITPDNLDRTGGQLKITDVSESRTATYRDWIKAVELYGQLVEEGDESAVEPFLSTLGNARSMAKLCGQGVDVEGLVGPKSRKILTANSRGEVLKQARLKQERIDTVVKASKRVFLKKPDMPSDEDAMRLLKGVESRGDDDLRDTQENAALYAHALAEDEEYAAAYAVFRAVYDTDPGVPKYWAFQALTQLRMGNVKLYKSITSAMMRRFGSTDDPTAGLWTASICTVVPNPDIDPTQLNHVCAVGASSGEEGVEWLLGASSYRIGEYEQAVNRFAAIVKKGDRLHARGHAFRAMALHALGRKDEAIAALAEAKAHRTEGDTWYVKLENEVVTAEAESLLGQKAAIPAEVSPTEASLPDS